MIELKDQEFALLRHYLESACGIEVGEDKRYLFTTRLQALLSELGCTSFSQFYAGLRGPNAVGQQALIEAMTTNETSFFRDGHPFDALEAEILQALVSRQPPRVDSTLPSRLRMLSVGCSSGEEAYSLAICAHFWLGRQGKGAARQISVLGVDVSKEALAAARGASYPSSALQSIPQRFRGYFKHRGEEIVVCDEIQELVTFSSVNLVQPLAHLGCFDLVCCRNVMIYFSAALKRRLVDEFFRMLTDGGVLILGASESLYTLSAKFETRGFEKTSYHCAMKS